MDLFPAPDDPSLTAGVPYFEFTQPGASFYACTLSAMQVIHRFAIKRRSEDPISGIQRDENAKRVSEIANYARRDDAIFPTPIILSANSEDFDLTGGVLRVRDPSNPVALGHVLDGQHRLLGLQQTDETTLRQIKLLVVFAFDIDRYAEASIFATINGNQRQVSKSLMYDLFSLSRGRSVERTCHEIVKSLNEDPVSPFFRKIKVLGRKAADQETLSQAAFIDHVRKLIDSDGAPLRRMYEAGEDWAIRKIVNNLFFALDQSVEAHPGRVPSQFFYKTTGFGGAVKAMERIAAKGFDSGNLSVDWFRTITDPFVEGFDAPKGVGNAAMIEVRDQLLRAAGVSQQPPLLLI